MLVLVDRDEGVPERVEGARVNAADGVPAPTRVKAAEGVPERAIGAP